MRPPQTRPPESEHMASGQGRLFLGRGGFGFAASSCWPRVFKLQDAGLHSCQFHLILEVYCRLPWLNQEHVTSILDNTGNCRRPLQYIALGLGLESSLLGFATSLAGLLESFRPGGGRRAVF